MERAGGVLDSVELSGLDYFVEGVGFFDIIDYDIGKLGRFEEIHKEFSLSRGPH